MHIDCSNSNTEQYTFEIFVNDTLVSKTTDNFNNKSLAEVMQANLEKVGGITYTEEEKAFSKKISGDFFEIGSFENNFDKVINTK